MAVRLVLIQGFLGGIAGTILFFAIILFNLDAALPGLALAGIVTYFIAIGMLGILVFISIFNTFKPKTFVHPDDKLWGNLFVFILFVIEVLTFGHFYQTAEEVSYTAGVMILIVFVFVYLVQFFGKSIGFHDMLDSKAKKEKEIVARFILLAMFLGGILVGLYSFFNWLYIAIADYNYSVLIIGLITVILLLIIGLRTWKMYQPIGDSKAQ